MNKSWPGLRALLCLLVPLALALAGCVKTRVYEVEETAEEPTAVKAEQPENNITAQGNHLPPGPPEKDRPGPALTGNIGPPPPSMVERTNLKLAGALLAYMDKKDPAALEPLRQYAAREITQSELNKHHKQALILLAVGRMLQDKQPAGLSPEQKVVLSFLMPASESRLRLREMLLTMLDKPLPGNKSATIYKQLKDGHFTFNVGLLKLFEKSGLLKIPQGAKVADVGCGVGSQTLDLARAVGATGKVYAVDIDTGVVAWLQHMVKQVPEGDRLLPVRSILEDVSLKPASLDLAMIHGINFLFQNEDLPVPEHAMALMESIQRALKPGGHLLIRSYQRTGRLIKSLTGVGYSVAGQYRVRKGKNKGPDGVMLEDVLVLFRRGAGTSPPKKTPIP